MSDVNIFVLGCVVFIIAATGAFQYGLVLFRQEYGRQNPREERLEVGASRSKGPEPGRSAHDAGGSRRVG